MARLQMAARRVAMLAGSTALISGLALAGTLQAAFAQAVTAVGDISPALPPSGIANWDLDEDTLSIGNSGEGTLTIEAGGRVSNGNGRIGRNHGSIGVVTVTGEGSSWENAFDLGVGAEGKGTLTVEAGGTVRNFGSGIIAWGGNGTATVTGEGSAWESNSWFVIGYDGQGTLTIEDGGRASSSSTWLGYTNDAIGTLNLNGTPAARGVLETGYVRKAYSIAVFNIDGGILRATGDETNFLENFDPGDVTIAVGGAYIDTNGFDIGIGTDLSGNGALTKEGTGTLTLRGENTYTGETTIRQGTLAVDGGSIDHTLSDLFVGLGNGDEGTLVVSNGSTVSNGFGYIGYNPGSIGAVTVTGKDSLWGNLSELHVGYEGDGTLTIEDGGAVGSWGTWLANPDSSGTLHLNGTEGARGVLETGFVQKAFGTAVFNIDGGVLRATRNQENFLRGFNTSDVLISGVGAFIDTNGFDIGIGTNLAGTSITKMGAGTLTLTGNNAFHGTSRITEGTLVVTGQLGALDILDGGTLAGNGTVGTTVVQSGGIIAPGNSIGTLTVDGDLLLTSGSILDYELGTPGTAANPTSGSSDRIAVVGNLELDGSLNLSQSGNPADGTAALGYYRLMTYGGTLTDGGLDIGIASAPADPALYQIQAGGGNVDLFVAAAGDDDLQHWQGGDGTWSAADARWLNQGGGLPAAWAGNHAVFRDEGVLAGGAIAVEDTQGFKGLQFVDNGYRLEGSGVLETDAAGSEIRVLADSAEIATRITGIGGISKTEAGTLALSGTNTYAGGTQLLGGVVQVSQDANLGAATGGLTFNGGTLATTSSFASGRNVNLLGDGAFDVADGVELTLSGRVEGAGSLYKLGEGELLLTRANAYGDTYVEAGTLVGNAASISGSIANAGTVIFDQAGDATFASDIAAFGGTSGSMVKDGAGILTLSGNSWLDWTVSDGGLVSSAGSFSGDVAIGNGGSFAFDRNDDVAYAGIFSGSGDFAKNGAGTLVLSGDSSAFSGQTTILGGVLAMGGASSALGGSITVGNGGRLGGSGTIGTITVTSGGTIAPGNSIGTMRVTGDLSFASGSTYAVETDPAGTDSDLIHVLGTAHLNNATVAHIGMDGGYKPFSAYTILTADGGIDGRFGAVSSAYAFLTPELDYHANNVHLELLRNDTAFADRAATPNQKATADGIDGLGFGNLLYDAIVSLPDNDTVIQGGFDQLSGEVHASGIAVLIENSQFLRQATVDRIRGSFGDIAALSLPVLAYGPGGPTLSAADTERFAAWGQAFGSRGTFDGDGNAAGLDTSGGGFVTGLDGLVSDAWRLGLMAGYSHIAFDAKDSASSGSSDNYHLGLYGGGQWGNLGIRSGFAYSWHDIETSRRIALPGLTESLEGEYSAGTFQAFGEAGYRIDTATVSFEPFASLAYVNLHTYGFTETGGAAALTAASRTTDVTFTTIGLRAETGFTVGTMKSRAHSMIGWRHAFGDTTPLSTYAFAGGDSFMIAGVPIAEDAAVIEAGFDLGLTDTATLGIAYDGQVGEGAQQHGFNAKLSVRF